MTPTSLSAADASFLAHADKVHALAVLADSPSFRAAASRLGIAPSTLSEKLQALERLFGRSLVERGAGQVKLTPLGLELVVRARGALSTLVELAPVASSRDRRRGLLRVGVYESLAVDVLPRVFSSLVNPASGARLEVQTGRSAALVSSLRRGQIDLAVVVGAAEDSEIESVQVATDELTLVRPHALELEEATRRLASGAWIGLSSSRAGPARFYQRFVEFAGLRPPALTCDSFEVVRSVAIASRNCALLPRRVARRTLEFMEVEVSDRARAESQHAIVLARRRKFAMAVFETFLSSLRQTMGEP